MGEPLIDAVRNGDYPRFLAIQLAPVALRPALYAVTALAVELSHVAEAVREPMLGHIRLAWWREALDEIVSGATPRAHPVVEALQAVYAQQPAVFPALYRMVEARAADLDSSLMAQEALWLDYLRNTAGALHEAWARLLMGEGAAACLGQIERHAQAFAMVGLARSLPYLVGQRRQRFPLALVPDIGALTREEAMAVTQALVGRALPLLREPLDRRLGKPMRALTAIAGGYAKALTRVGYDATLLPEARLSLVLRVIAIKYF